MKHVGVDTETLIHAFEETSPGKVYPEREREMIVRAKILLNDLEIEGATIMVPAVVVAEYLTGVDAQHHEATLDAFQKKFEIPPFDLKSSIIASRLWRAHRTLPQPEQLSRIVLKSDVLIIATLKAFGATHYFSNDRASRRLAEQAGLIANDLPERSRYLIPDAVTPKKPNKAKGLPHKP